jgi:hypothetical protein
MVKQWREKKPDFWVIVITFFILTIFVIQTVAANNSTSGPAKGYADIITIDTIENHTVGDSFTIHGKTAQPVGQTLFILVWPNSYRHATMGDAYRSPVYESGIAYQWFLLTSAEMKTEETTSVTQVNVSCSPISSVTQQSPLPTGIVFGSLLCATFLVSMRCRR